MKYYVAYGSNLNKKAMSKRCSTAVPFGTSAIKNCKLEFRGTPGFSYLTLVASPGDIVPLGVWQIEDSDELSLDRYEGYPHLYHKVKVPVVRVKKDDGTQVDVEAFMYLMNQGYGIAEPSRQYISICMTGFEDFKLPTEALLTAAFEANVDIPKA